jgi:ketosteroid isomerase-like protein
MVYLDEQVIRQLYDAFNNHNFEAIVKLYSDNVRLICPGRSQVSGEHQGRQGVLSFWNKQFEISENTFNATVLAVVENDEHIVVITDVGLKRGGKTYAWRRLLHFVMYDARVKECWIFEGDQYQADEAFK